MSQAFTPAAGPRKGSMPCAKRTGRNGRKWRCDAACSAVCRGASLNEPSRPDLETRRQQMQVKISRNDKGNPPGKLADAELHFSEGVLDGLKLIGFSIWERRNGSGRNVTFPARQYSVNGERRSFALLRPLVDTHALDRLRDMILEAYEALEEHEAMAE
jgi:hypothetical protein